MPEPLAGTRPRPGHDPHAAKDAVIAVRDIEKTYPNGTRAVRGVSFFVKKGEIYGILGPNGAGKSTLIGILGTLVKPTAGSAQVDGLDVTRASLQVRKRIGFAMQEAGVDTLAKGLEFLVLQGRLYGMKRRVAEARARELLRLFELEEAADKLVAGYSGGMKRRIDLAGALIHRPPILFLDEPTEGLDPRSRRTLWSALKRLNREQGATILLSTHYMEEADHLCDRLAIIDRGEIVAVGTPEELKTSVGGQSVVLRFDTERDPEALRRAERTLVSAGVAERLQRTEDELFAYVGDAGVATPAILRALDAAGIPPQTLSIQKPTLDDVYLQYTGRTIEAAEAKKAPEASGAADARRQD